MVVSPSVSATTAASWRRHLRRHLPILGWLPCYDRSAAIADAIAGTTSGLTMIAQAIAYAALAELPAQYGLYSAFVGSLVYVFLGTIEAVSIGPSSLNALLTLQYTTGRPVEYVVVLAFLNGAVQFLIAVLQLGFVVDFISVPVTSAFMSATVIIIVTSQLKNFFGLAYSSSRFVDTFSELHRRLGDSVAGDMWLSLGCCTFLLAAKGLQMWRWDERTARGRRCKAITWYLGILSNGLLVLCTSLLAYAFAASASTAGGAADAVPFRVSGHVTPGLPPFRLPPFEFEHNNETVHFAQIVADLGGGVLVVPLATLMANAAIGKSLAAGRSVDTTQEMLTLGVCNMLGACFSSMPTGGAFARSSVIRASGVRTPMHGAYSAAVILLALTLLTPYFYYIPRASLAAVLVVSVVFMVDRNFCGLKLHIQINRNTFALDRLRNAGATVAQSSRRFLELSAHVHRLSGGRRRAGHVSGRSVHALAPGVHVGQAAGAAQRMHAARVRPAVRRGGRRHRHVLSVGRLAARADHRGGQKGRLCHASGAPVRAFREAGLYVVAGALRTGQGSGG